MPEDAPPAGGVAGKVTLGRVPFDLSRRGFLRTAQGLALAGPLAAFNERLARRESAGATRADGYGPIEPARDGTTGLPLLQVPRGFYYLSFGWRGDRLEDGRITPGAHDGMAAFAGPEGRVRLIRNHELDTDFGTFGGAPAYDPRAGGGTTTLEFDPASGTFLRAWASLCGTSRNCAGGPTPWGSWLTCEETLVEPRTANGFQRAHGYVFEVPAVGKATAQPLPALGRFVHEAVAVDPERGVVYLTEDHGTAGFYRFLPKRTGHLADGGALEMLAVDARPRFDTRRGQRSGTTFPVHWVPIRDPERPHRVASAGDSLGVASQGFDQGAAIFGRLEGAWFGGGMAYFNATSGGDAGSGQVWEYSPSRDELRLVFESPAPSVLNKPDNLTVSPRGGIAICEDGSDRVQRIHGLTRDGQLFPFIRNNVALNGERGYRGDFRDREFTGVTFSPDGRWMFFNIQSPGITFAVMGPWEEGKL
jgi:hypothetical protein